MKKIIIASLVAAVGFTATASNCAPTPVKDTAWVYQWKFTGKTTKGRAIKARSVSACAPAGESCTIRVPASLKIQGYTYACSPMVCDDDNLGFETAFVEMNEVFWMKKPYKSSFAGGVITEVAHLIGKSKKTVEIGGKTALTDDAGTVWTLTYAGFGKYHRSNKYVKSVKGNFAGFASRSLSINAKSCSTSIAGYWACDTLTLSCVEAPTIAYGKWSAKFKKTASKKFIKGIAPKTPSWVVARNLAE